ncbi:hypothetical protein V2J09_007690 [Rumex salicifolius]
MESTTRLDYVLFQLTPTRTRCDLVIFAGKLNEKLAYGLLEPFVLHLQSAKDQISKGGYSVTLRPPPPAANPAWFTKATLERFVRFVSTPEVLERVITIETEIQQIENSIQSYETSNALDTDGFEDNFKSASKSKGECNGNTDGSLQENSKIRLKRVLDTRRAVLGKEQAMAYARALAAGYEMYNLDDLLSFADAFGASRLRDACMNFIDLCKKKNEDRLWMDEIAAMQALPHPDLSYLGSSGIVLAGEDNIQGASDSSVSHGSSDINADQMPSTDGKAQIPFPWGYMQNFQGFQGMPTPPYQGYGFPPYYPNNMQWPPNANTGLGSDREADDHHIHKSSSKKKNRKRRENVQKSGDSELDDSSTDSDSSANKKKCEKKSSRRVVIRNINYITSNRNGDKAEESSNGDDYLDGDSHHGRRRDGIKNNGSFENENENETTKGKRGDDNWDAFQQLLLREDSDSTESRLIQVEEGSIQKFNTGKSLSKKGNTRDEFIMLQRNDEDRFSSMTPSDGASRSSMIRSQGGDDWITRKMSSEAGNNTNIDFGLIDERDDKLKKEMIGDDSLMIQARSMDDIIGTRLRFDPDMVSDTAAKSSEPTAIAEPEELFMVLDRGTSVDYQAASWTPEMDFENKTASNSKDVANVDSVLSSTVKDTNKKTKPALARDAKSRSLSKSKPELAPKNSRPPWGSRAATNKSKPNKEEESRKRREELLLQRQKRIAERSTMNSFSLKKTTTANRTKSGSLTEKPKFPTPKKEDTKKTQKSVVRSSTIDRLAAAKTVIKESATTSSKSIQPKKKPSKVNSRVPQKSTPADQNKPIPNKTKTSEANSEPKTKDITAESPSETIIAEDIHVPVIVAAESKDIKELHVTSTAVDKYEEKPTSETNVVNESSDVSDLPKPVIVDNEPSSHCEVEDEQVVEKCMTQPEVDSNTVQELPTGPVKATVEIGDTNYVTPSYREISEIEESTPPTHVLSAESGISRKKWITVQDPPKEAKGFRKLLMFGRRRRIQYA